MIREAAAISAADAAFVTGDGGCDLSASDQGLIDRLTIVLHAVNAGEVTYNVMSPRLTAPQQLSISAVPEPNNSTPVEPF